MKMRAADAMVRVLRNAGVRHIFGLPGDHGVFYDALRKDGSIQHVLIRHEQAAAHAADGYARASGRLGVCDASSGPGATNLVTGIAEAWASSIPVLAIAASARLAIRGRNVFQDLDQTKLFGSITKAAYDLTDPSRVPEWTRRGIAKALGGRPGPVILNVPSDVLGVECDYAESDFDVSNNESVWPSHRAYASPEDVQEVARRLHRAVRPVIWCGGGTIASGAWTHVLRLAELTGAAVATTFMGKGAIPENHPLSIGPVGALGRPMTNDYVRSADFVLAIGSRFTNLDTAGWTVPARTAQVVQVDIDPCELGHHQTIAMGICADAASFTEALANQCINFEWMAAQRQAEVSKVRGTWLVERGTESPGALCVGEGPVHPLQAVAALRAAMSPEDTIVNDSGFNQIWGGQYFEVHRAGRSYIGPRGMGVMGFGFPGALGAATADPDRRFVVLVGDGGFMMVIQELETAKRRNIPVVVVVLNNGNLEYCKAGQSARYNGLTTSCDFSETDFAAIARSFGCEGLVVERPDQLKPTFERALACGRPVVVDVRTVGAAMPDGLKF